MSAPCFARMIAEGATGAFVRTATQRGDVPQHLVFGHEPLLHGERLAVQPEEFKFFEEVRLRELEIKARQNHAAAQHDTANATRDVARAIMLAGLLSSRSGG